MKSCVGCKYAKWELTKVGGLHPNMRGECLYVKKLKKPKLPQCLNGFFPYEIPKIGTISRKIDFEDHCVFYVPGDYLWEI